MRKARNPPAELDAAAPGLAGEETRRWPATPWRIGISGWTYPPWRGVFYPKGLAHRLELRFASRQHNTIEINGSFYSLQRPSSYQHWYRETPEGFLFSVKGPRFITHMKKLREVEKPLANFFGSGVLALREKLGPILWQFPPNFGWNEERFRQFFEMLPRDTATAAELAKGHDENLKHGVYAQTDLPRPIRYAVEVRHPTFMVPEFFALLREHNIAFVFADTAGKWPYTEDLTADFIYCRLHGAEQLYVSGYSDQELDWWAARLGHWHRGKRPTDAVWLQMRKPMQGSATSICISTTTRKCMRLSMPGSSRHGERCHRSLWDNCRTAAWASSGGCLSSIARGNNMVRWTNGGLSRGR